MPETNAAVPSPGKCIIRTMTRAEVDLAVEWAAKEGWNPGLHDADCFFAADPAGFLGAEVDGQLVGCISSVRYEPAFGFLGFYIMRPEYRGRGGIGFALGNAGVARVKDLNAGQDGVVAQQEHYKHLWGFQLAHRNVRYEIKGAVPRSGDGAGTVPLTQVPFELLAAYDREMFRASREAFLQCWISRPGTVARGVVEGGELGGYGVVRPCRVGYKIGPLFADSPGIAEKLFVELASHAGEGPLYLDVPQVNPGAVSMAERYGMTPVFETARMYTKGDPGLPLHRIYGITSFELG